MKQKKLKRIFSLNKKKQIAVIRLSGVIGKMGRTSSGMSLENLKHLDDLKKIKNLQAIALLINSPGGSPVQSELICKKIQNLAKEYNQKTKKKLPIYAFCEDVAASGGYFLACCADKIYASNSSIIGSIGVISSGFGFNETIKKLGIERRIHTQGKNKAILDPFSPEKKEDIAIISTIQKDIHDEFINIVKNSRKTKLTGKDSDIFNGKFWSGKEALKLGLIDEIGYFEDVLKEEYGDKINFKYLTQPKGFFQKKFNLSSSQDNMAQKITSEISSQISEFLSWRKFDL
jgi:signal peptide peptidase SppA